MTFRLRRYQQDAFAAILESWHEHRSVLLNLPTGLGKTALASAVMHDQATSGKRCCFVADTNELCDQPLRAIERVTGELPTLEKANEHARRDARFTVASLQTLSRDNRLESFDRKHFDLLVFDESHRQVEQHQKVMHYFEKARVLGLTATAFRSDMADLSEFYDAVAYSMDIEQAIEQGLMPPITIDTAPIRIDISEVRSTLTSNGRDYSPQELSKALRPYYERVAQYIKEHASERHIAAYLPLVVSSKEFVTVCIEAGIRAVHVDGESPDRGQILADFAARKHQLISCSALLTTGWDQPTVDCIVNLRPTRSVGLFRQIVGRGTRVLPGVIEGIEDVAERKEAIARSAKKDLLLLDFIWATSKLGVCGPAAIISDSPDEIASMSGKCSTGDLVASVKAEREAKLKRELDEAAKREARFVQISSIAGLVDASELIDFQPIMRWEKEAKTDKQALALKRFGIDPDKVTSKGHASKILGILFKRQDKGLASLQTLWALRKQGRETTSSTTEEQALELIGDNLPMPFGKWRGVPMGDVPDSFFEWFLKQSWASSWPTVVRYARKLVEEKRKRISAAWR